MSAKTKLLENDPIEVFDFNTLEVLSRTYKLRQDISFKCEKCNKIVTKVSLRASLKRLSSYGILMCRGCTEKIVKTNHYGEDYKKQIAQKRKETILAKSDDEKKRISDKVKASWKKKSKEEIQEITKKKENTNYRLYGVRWSSQAENSRNAQKETWKNKTKDELKDIQSKRRASCKKLYGVEIATQKPEIAKRCKEHCEKTMLEKYGVKNSFQLESTRTKLEEKLKECRKDPEWVEMVKEHTRKACLERYEVENYGMTEMSKEASSRYWKSLTEEEWELYRQTRSKGFKYDGQIFDSKPELAFWIWCKENGKNICRESKKLTYIFNGEEKTYIPDFVVDDQMIEIKGDHFVKENGEWQNPFDHKLDPLMEAKHKFILTQPVKILYRKDYQKYVDYVEEKYTKDFLNLFNIKIPFPYLNPNLKEKTDFAIIQHFHKSIYEASKKDKPSPLDAWQDKDIIKKVALNRLKYVGSCKPSDILQGLSVTRIAPKISVFKPSTAEYLIEKYLSEFSEIVDPFSGFSGRMIGSMNCGKKYTGKDINEKHVLESNEIIQYKEYQNCSIVVEDLLKKENTEIHECLFTCPPYGGKEHWNKNNDEVEKTCDEWIDICLQKYKCKKYLFVVDETEKYKDRIVENLQNKKGLFSNRQEFVILIENP